MPTRSETETGLVLTSTAKTGPLRQQLTSERCGALRGGSMKDAQQEELTVYFVSFVENVALKVLLLLHGGVKLRIVVLKQK